MFLGTSIEVPVTKDLNIATELFFGRQDMVQYHLICPGQRKGSSRKPIARWVYSGVPLFSTKWEGPPILVRSVVHPSGLSLRVPTELTPWRTSPLRRRRHAICSSSGDRHFICKFLHNLILKTAENSMMAGLSVFQ